MNIIVCIKQVPETTDIKIDPKTNTLIREGTSSIINPYDMYAIEEAIRIKEKAGAEVTVITMGPPQAEAALREAISIGCDKAVLITDRAFAGSDTWATSYTLAEAIRKLGSFDLIIAAFLERFSDKHLFHQVYQVRVDSLVGDLEHIRYRVLNPALDVRQ